MNINGMEYATKVTTTDITNGVKDDSSVIYSIDGERLLRCEDRAITQYTIRDGVKVICDNAFKSCTELNDINIGDEVICIGEHAFDNCNLVSLETGNSVKYIGNFAFQDCWRLTTVFLASSVMEINGTAFAYGNDLINFEIAEDNEYICIEEGVIYSKDMTKLMLVAEKNDVPESFTIPLSVTSIGDYAFFDCKRLLEIIGRGRITSIGKAAFRECRRLRSLTIPSTIKTVGKSEEGHADEDVFMRCYRIENICVQCFPTENEDDVRNSFRKLLPQRLHNKIEITFRSENDES